MGKPIGGMMATYQLVAGDVTGFRHDGALIALLGLWPLPDNWRECFVLGDRAACAPHMLALSRLARLTLTERAQSGVVGFRGLVRAGHAPGGRLARLAGFHLVRAERGFELYERAAADG